MIFGLSAHYFENTSKEKVGQDKQVSTLSVRLLAPTPVISKKVPRFVKNTGKKKSAVKKSNKKIEQIVKKRLFKQDYISGKKVSAHYLLELKKYLNQHKFFPRQARRLRHFGKVEVSFVISKDGSFSLIKLSRTCPYDSLNSAALSLVKGLKKFKPLPVSIKSDLRLNIPLNYVLGS